jgi:hypothetical protein
MQQSILPHGRISVQQPTLALDSNSAILCCPWRCLLYSKLLYSTADCAAPGRVCSTAAYMLWRRHIRHNQTVRQAVEYCTIYLNPHVGG